MFDEQMDKGATKQQASHAHLERFLDSKRLNAVEEYVARGRIFERLSDEELTILWVNVFKALADNPLIGVIRRLETDLASEFRARGREPPYETIKEAVDRFLEFMRKATDTARVEPGRATEAGEAVRQEVADIKAARNGEKN